MYKCLLKSNLKFDLRTQREFYINIKRKNKANALLWISTRKSNPSDRIELCLRNPKSNILKTLVIHVSVCYAQFTPEKSSF